MQRIFLPCGLAAGLLLGGCVTITKGTTEQVTPNSEPVGAAVQTSTGLQCPSTPCTFEVPRKQEFIATFSKAGFASQQVPVNTRLGGSGAAGFAGNVLLSCSQSTVLSTGDCTGSAQALIFRMPTARGGA